MPASRKPIDEALAMAGVVRAPAKALALPENHSGADTDERLIELWLARYDSEHTRRAYANDIEQFLEVVDALPKAPRGLHELTVAHLMAYVTYLREESSPATQARRVSSVKSLLSFGHTTGYLPWNVGAAIKTPKFHDHVGERILTVDQVRELVAAARPGRDRTLIKFLYFAGARISEALGLQWKHLRRDGAVLRVTLHGKGKKTRHVPLPSTLIADFDMLERSRLGSYVFESVYGNPLCTKSGWEIVHRAARDAFLKGASPHWLRHAHVTHALQRGAPVHVVKDTVGHASLSTTGRYAHLENDESSGLFLSL